MKIEICEQIIYSWLQHIKGCQVVQTNWSPSPLSEIADENLSTVEEFINAVKDFTKDDEIDIFKKSTVNQVIMQCEIDVVGIKILDGNVDDLYFVDSAFHENGLNYKNNTANVTKKILRAILVADLVFRNVPAKIVFVSPFVRDSVSTELKQQLSALDVIVKQYYPDVDIILIFNEDFANEVYAPLMSHLDILNNNNELFLRNAKLIKIADSFISKGVDNLSYEVPARNMITTASTERTRRGGNEQRVFEVLHILKSKNLLTDDLIRKLQNPSFAKQQFKMPTFPFLITEENFRTSGFDNCRFYRNKFSYNEVIYRVCSQWIPERIRMLDFWIENLTNK